MRQEAWDAIHRRDPTFRRSTYLYSVFRARHGPLEHQSIDRRFAVQGTIPSLLSLRATRRPRIAPFFQDGSVASNSLYTIQDTEYLPLRTV